MQDVKLTEKKRLGKAALPEGRRRVLRSTRITPETLEFLEGLGCENIGRAIDTLVRAIKRKEVASMMSERDGVRIVKIS